MLSKKSIGNFDDGIARLLTLESIGIRSAVSRLIMRLHAPYPRASTRHLDNFL